MHKRISPDSSGPNVKLTREHPQVPFLNVTRVVSFVASCHEDQEMYRNYTSELNNSRDISFLFHQERNRDGKNSMKFLLKLSKAGSLSYNKQHGGFYDSVSRQNDNEKTVLIWYWTDGVTKQMKTRILLSSYSCSLTDRQNTFSCYSITFSKTTST